VRKRKHLLATAAMLCAAVPAHAIFGVGDVVFDPSAWGELVSQTTYLIDQYHQLTATYNEMIRQAKYPQGMLARFRAPLAPWRPQTAPDAYGNLAGWLQAINAGLNPQGGWAAATQPLIAPGMTGLTAAGQQDRKTDYASLELLSGTAVHTLDTAGQAAATAPATAAVLANLEADSLSDNPDLQTQAAQMARANAIALVNARQAQTANQVLVSLANHQTVQAKMASDSAAREFAVDAVVRTQGPQLHSSQDWDTTISRFRF
jgi:type IV secretion system protein TrbJ